MGGHFLRIGLRSSAAKRTGALALALGAVAAVHAYEPGGHFYSVSEVFRLEANPALSEQRRVEAFCTQLPDLAEELDAITQRKHVLWNPKDLWWGIASKCTTPTSKHMYAAQYYLHALTGKESEKVRNAAVSLLGTLEAQLNGGLTLQQQANIWCERGFATHLLGDTYAHTQLALHPAPTLYDTGLGHFRDFRKPDLMLMRPALWEKLLTQESSSVAQHQLDISPLKSIEYSIPHPWDDNGGAEDSLRVGLHRDLKDGGRADLVAYQPDIETWNDDSVHGSWFNAPQKAWNEHFLTATCQAQMNTGPQGKGAGLPPLDGGVRPNCDDVWRDYLAKALEAFAAVGVKGTDCDVAGDELKNGHVD